MIKPYLKRFEELLQLIERFTIEPDFYTHDAICWLSDYYGDCIKIIILKGTSHGGESDFNISQRLHNADPNAKKYLVMLNQHELPICSNSTVSEVLEKINIDAAEIIKVCTPSKNNYSHTIVFTKYSWSKITADRLFYYFLASNLSKLESEYIQDFNAFTSSNKVSHAKNYLRSTQKMLIRISSELVLKFDKPALNVNKLIKSKYSTQEFYALVYSSIENILVFFERFYNDLIDYSEVLPVYYASKRFKALAPKTTYLRTFFLKNIHDIELLNLLYLPLLPVTASSFEYKITYYDLMYSETYIDRFYEYCSKCKNDDNFIGIIKVLIELNYNNLDFMVWLTDGMTNSLNQQENDAMKSKLLFSWLKSLNQTFTRIPKGYFPEQNSLKQRLNTWIDEELLYIKLTTEKMNDPQISLGSMGLDKMQTTFSVAQLALFFRLQYEANIVESKSQKHLLNLVAQTIQTSKVHAISPKSLMNKYYEFDEGTIEFVKHKLIEMLNILNGL